MQTAHNSSAKIVAFPPHRVKTAQGALSPATMAQHLRETNPVNARCFALEMYEHAAWANEAWGEYWANVAKLV